MLKPLLISILLILYFFQGLSQTNAKIIDADGSPVPKAVVSLFKNHPKNILQTTLSDNEGKFYFSISKTDSLRIQITAIGYKDTVPEML